MREDGRFQIGHKPLVGAFGKGSKHTDGAKQLISRALLGNKRRWRGDEAGYVAKHLWIVKHYGNATKCENENCTYPNPKRYEWANVSGDYLRNREDYRMLCPSCHRKLDAKGRCRQGHLYTADSTYTNNRGHRRCLICWNNRRKANATNI